MDGPDNKYPEDFNEYRKFIINNADFIYRGKLNFWEYSDRLFNEIKAVYDKSRVLISSFAAGDFAFKFLTPFSTAKIIIPVFSDEDILIAVENCNRLKDGCRYINHNIEFSIVQVYNPEMWTAQEMIDLFTANTEYCLGSESLLFDLNNKFYSYYSIQTCQLLCAKLLMDRDNRYNHFGNTPHLVEPNVYNTAGGLADFLLSGLFIKLLQMDAPQPAKLKLPPEILIDFLLDNDLITSTEHNNLIEAVALLMHIRWSLHIQSHAGRDWFEEKDQLFLSQRTRLSNLFPLKKEAADSTPAKDFIRLFHSATALVSRTLNNLVKNFRSALQLAIPDDLSLVLDNEFSIKAGAISLNADSVLNQLLIMRAFLYRGLYNAWFDDRLRINIIRFCEHSEPEDDIETSAYFRKILSLGKNAGNVFASMHELGFLGFYLQAFKDSIGLTQYGVYYHYTTDYHTILTIKKICQLDARTSFFGKVFSSLANPDVLFLAALFHDLGKSVELEGHHLLSAEIAEGFMEKSGFDESKINMVTFLIRNHCLMHRAAFKNYPSNPETIESFAKLFPSLPALDHLFLLSYGIIAAVNPKVFTSWKEELLIELYRKTRQRIERKISDQDLFTSKAGETKLHLKHRSFESHLATFDDPQYVRHFSDLEIQHHIEKIESGDTVSVYFIESSSKSKITVITKDTNYLLSKICGVIAINQINIHDARIFTRNDGIVVDTFTVTDAETGGTVQIEKLNTLESQLKSVISGMMQVGFEVKKLKAQWNSIKRTLLKKHNDIKIKFESHDIYTVILIQAPDMPGFLYQVTRRLNDLGLHIYFAKIATEKGDIFDAFYVLDRTKSKVSKNYYHFVESQLKQVIDKL